MKIYRYREGPRKRQTPRSKTLCRSTNEFAPCLETVNPRGDSGKVLLAKEAPTSYALDVLVLSAMEQETSTGWCVVMARLACLKPHERHDEAAARRLAAEIGRIGVWTVPIAVDALASVILDGHHRRRAAQLLGLTAVPTVPVAYENPGVTLASWRRGESWSPHEVRARAASGRLLPPQSTRHIFAPDLGTVAVPISRLREG